MIRVESSTIINRHIEDVFAYATDFSRYSEWIPEVKESKKTSDGPVGVGATEWEKQQIMYLWNGEGTSEVTEYEPNRKIVFGVTSEVLPPWRSAYSFELVEGGTKVTWVLEYEPKGFLKLISPILPWFQTKSESGLYVVEIGSEAGALDILTPVLEVANNEEEEKPEIDRPPAPFPTSGLPEESISNLGLIFGIVGGLIIVGGLLYYFLFFRKQRAVN